MMRKRSLRLEPKFMQKLSQHLRAFEVLARDGPRLARMIIGASANLFQGVRGFGDIAHSEQTRAAWQVPTESSFLLHHGSSACEIRSTAVAEPTRLQRHKNIFAHAELGKRTLDVI